MPLLTVEKISCRSYKISGKQNIEMESYRSHGNTKRPKSKPMQGDSKTLYGNASFRDRFVWSVQLSCHVVWRHKSLIDKSSQNGRLLIYEHQCRSIHIAYQGSFYEILLILVLSLTFCKIGTSSLEIGTQDLENCV